MAGNPQDIYLYLQKNCKLAQKFSNESYAKGPGFIKSRLKTNYFFMFILLTSKIHKFK